MPYQSAFHPRLYFQYIGYSVLSVCYPHRLSPNEDLSNQYVRVMLVQCNAMQYVVHPYTAVEPLASVCRVWWWKYLWDVSWYIGFRTYNLKFTSIIYTIIKKKKKTYECIVGNRRLQNPQTFFFLMVSVAFVIIYSPNDHTTFE